LRKRKKKITNRPYTYKRTLTAYDAQEKKNKEKRTNTTEDSLNI